MAIYLRGKSWYYDFIHKGQRYTGSFGPVSRTVAKEELVRKKAEVVEGRLNPAKARKSPRFTEFAKEYEDWIHANRRPETHRRIAGTIRRLVEFFGTKKLNELTPWHLEQFKKARKDAGLLPNSVNVEVAVLKAILKKACSWGQLANDPGKDIKLLKVTQRKTRFLSEEEEGTLLAVCSPALRCIIEVGLLTGFRRRELISLQADDVDLVRETVTVAAANSKNGESRTLPMGPRLKTLFREALEIRGTAPTALTDEHEPWGYRAFANRFQKACGDAGVELLSPHVLRHTFASRLVMAGVDLRTVQELMGHKNILMTMRYAHLSPDHKRMAMKTLETRFSAKSPATFHNTPPAVPSEEQKKRVGAR